MNQPIPGENLQTKRELRNQQIIQAYQNNQPINQLAKQFNLSRQTIRCILIKNKSYQSPKKAQKLIKQIIQLYQNNHSTAQIAKITQIKTQTIYEFLKKEKLYQSPKINIEARNQEIIQFYQNNKHFTLKQIAQKFNLKTNTLWAILKKLDILRPKQKKKQKTKNKSYRLSEYTLLNN